MTQLDYSHQVTTLFGEDMSLSAYEGKVMLIVNTASKCGFTPQYEGLEKLHQDYKDQGLVVLGFPCNQFGSQEPGTSDDIKSFCMVNYGVSFTMHQKVDVNGDGAHPLYKQLKTARPGLLGTTGIKWNFTKFIVDRQGKITARHGSRTKPAELRGELEALLQA